MAAMRLSCTVKPLLVFFGTAGLSRNQCFNCPRRCSTAVRNQMETGEQPISPKVIDSHLHVWASPTEAAQEYPYFPGQEPSLSGHVDFLLECMEEAGVDGALIVQPINHKFDHSYVTSALKKHPSKFSGCCLANPAEDGCGIKEFENLVIQDGYCAVRFNPYLWPSDQKMTNNVGKALFSRAGELGVPVGFMCMKGLNLHLQEIETLCSEFPSTMVLLDHLAFCKPPANDEENQNFYNLLKLSRFPQVYVKFSALFRVSRNSYPYIDLSRSLSQVVSSYGANRVMWGSDFPFVVSECGYKEAKEAVLQLMERISLSSSEMELIMGKTVQQIFKIFCRNSMDETVATTTVIGRMNNNQVGKNPTLILVQPVLKEVGVFISNMPNMELMNFRRFPSNALISTSAN